MAADSDQERTEEPSQKRLDDAKNEGQVVRSRELNTLLSLLGSGIALFWVGPLLIDQLRELLTSELSFDAALAHDAVALQEHLQSSLLKIIMALLPFLGLICLLSLIGPIAVGGWSFNSKSFMPQFSRMNPVSGLARMFSVKALLELAKALIKVIVVGGAAYLVLKDVFDDVLVLSLVQIDAALTKSGSLLLWSLVGFSSALFLVAGIDVPYQLWNHRHQLMMTKQELKDEAKESEGQPEVKMAIRRRQQEMSQKRMMQAVPNADVIITNPTHYAVALRYDSVTGGAPIVLAKGKDHIAAKIREIAQENSITLFSAPPLARALYASTELNKEIPADLFVAVAQVLAYIYQLRRAVGSKKPEPPKPTDLPVPPSYDLSPKL
jgi:flagellar biosynthesis protein FlhB